MSNEIKIQKNTGILLVGLFLAIVLGGYFVLGSTASTAQSSGGNAITPSDSSNQPSTAPSVNGGAQEVYLKATGSGYDKMQITVKKGIPVRLHFTAQNAGCGSYLKIYGIDGANVLSQNGQEAIVEFTPTQEGTYQYTCGMRMFAPGKFIVTA